EYIVEECPMAEGNRHLGYKDALTALETQSPGTRAAFVGHFFHRGSAAFARNAPADPSRCVQCGAPTHSDICQFCRIQAAAQSAPAPTRIRPTEQNASSL
ncbi:MAG: hypothetical protein ACOYN3_06985, partial [Acidimicrobiia bacterium]